MSDKAGDIDAYRARIGYSGPCEAALAVLQTLVARDSAAIPFENLDVLFKRPIRLDLPSLHAKLVGKRRGGYCFEHNLLLLDVLRRIGLSAVGLAARVQWGRPAGTIGPRTHMLLRVDLAEGPYLADVGFGGPGPTAPLALQTGSEQATPHGPFRLVAAGDEFDLEARLGGEWASLYRFSLQEQMTVDYEVANWFTSTHPNSLFVNHLIAARLDPVAATPSSTTNSRFVTATERPRDALSTTSPISVKFSSATSASRRSGPTILPPSRQSQRHKQPIPVLSTAARISQHPLPRTIIVETEEAKWTNRLSTNSPAG